MSKVIQDGGHLSGVAVLTLAPKPRVGVPPVYGEPVEPHLSLVRVKLLQTRVKTVDLAPRAGQGTLQQPVAHPQPATPEVEVINWPGLISLFLTFSNDSLIHNTPSQC